MWGGEHVCTSAEFSENHNLTALHVSRMLSYAVVSEESHTMRWKNFILAVQSCAASLIFPKPTPTVASDNAVRQSHRPSLRLFYFSSACFDEGCLLLVWGCLMEEGQQQEGGKGGGGGGIGIATAVVPWKAGVSLWAPVLLQRAASVD